MDEPFELLCILARCFLAYPEPENKFESVEDGIYNFEPHDFYVMNHNLMQVASHFAFHINTTMKYKSPTKSRIHRNKSPIIPAAYRMSVVASNFSEAELGEKLHHYVSGFQLIADRYSMQNLTKEDIKRIHAVVKKDWGPGLTYEYPRTDDLEGIKKLFALCDKWYEEIDSTTDNVKYVFHYYDN